MMIQAHYEYEEEQYTTVMLNALLGKIVRIIHVTFYISVTYKSITKQQHNTLHYLLYAYIYIAIYLHLAIKNLFFY